MSSTGTLELGEAARDGLLRQAGGWAHRRGTLGRRALVVVGTRPPSRHVGRDRRGERSRARCRRQHHLRGIGRRPRPHRRRRRTRLQALPHALRGRGCRRLRRGRLDRPRGADRQRGRLARRQRRALRRHDVRSGHGQARLRHARRAGELPRRHETTEPLPLGVVGDVVSPGRVRVGDPVIPAA